MELILSLFDQRESLIRHIVTVNLPVSGFNSNMISLKYFYPTILFARILFELAFETILDLEKKTDLKRKTI